MAILHPFTVVEVIRDAVVNPSPASFLPMFLFSFFNDTIGLFPFALYLGGQLVFYDGAFNLALMAKLLVFVAVPVGIGSSCGSIPLYLVAYFGGKPLIVKYEGFFKKVFRFSWSNVEKVNTYFKGVWYDEVIFLGLRCLPVMPSFPLDVAAGVLRMPFMPFFVLTVVGSIIRMMLTLIAFAVSLHGLHDLWRF